MSRMQSEEGEAAAAEIAHQTRVSQQALCRSFVSKKSLLDSTIEWEKDAFAHGIATAIAGSCGEGKLEAALRFIVEYQKSSAHRMVDVEPVHTIGQLGPMIPILREQLRRLPSP
jgi:AcrR family transcriptional regulator